MLISCIFVSPSLMKDYFFKPPINEFSLNFLDQELERSYRTSYQEEVCFLFCLYWRNLLFASDSSLSALCLLAVFFFFNPSSDRQMKPTTDFSQSVSLKQHLQVNLSTQRKLPIFLGSFVWCHWHVISRPLCSMLALSSFSPSFPETP